MSTAALIWSLLVSPTMPAWGDMPTDARDVVTAEDCSPDDSSCDDLRPWLRTADDSNPEECAQW